MLTKPSIKLARGHVILLLLLLPDPGKTHAAFFGSARTMACLGLMVKASTFLRVVVFSRTTSARQTPGLHRPGVGADTQADVHPAPIQNLRRLSYVTDACKKDSSVR